ncbi:MAG: MBL fold metallo-hydrolase [Armatimonadota bacterium]
MPLRFHVLVVGPLEVNCYILRDEATGKCAIIDPGGDCDRIVSAAGSPGFRSPAGGEAEYEVGPTSSSETGASAKVSGVDWILLTHGHFDHTYCAGDLATRFGVRVGIHEADVPLLGQGLGVAEMFYDVSGCVPVTPTDLLADGQTITLGESKIKVIHTPGHSPGGLSFATEAGVFCGDALFAGSIGRTDFPGGSFERLIASIRSKLLTLPDSTPLYPGHGPATSVGTERKNNPYLR